MQPNVDVDKISFFREKRIQSISTLGGASNHNYLITCDKGQFVYRVPGENTDMLINRKAEQSISLETAIRGFNSEVLYQDETGRQVLQYIAHNPLTRTELVRPDFLKALSSRMRELHDGKLFNHFIDIFKRNERIFEFLYSGSSAFIPGAEFQDLKEKYDHVRNMFRRIPLECMPCHNDIIMANVIIQAEKIFFIDWEYSGNNDPIWDLANLSVQSRFSVEEDASLLNYYYFDNLPPLLNLHKFHLLKFVVEIWRTLWAKLQLRNNNNALPSSFYKEQYDQCISNCIALAGTAEFIAAMKWAELLEPPNPNP